MKLLVPRPTLPRIEGLPRVRTAPRNPLEPLVRQALDASFGQISPEELSRTLMDVTVHAHVRARLRTPRPMGHVEVVSCHAREGGEYFGTVSVAGKRYGFAARMRGGRLVSFKVL